MRVLKQRWQQSHGLEGIMDVEQGFTIAKWFKNEAGIVAFVLACFNVAQAVALVWMLKHLLSRIKDQREHFIGVTEQWATRIDQFRTDVKEAFAQVKMISDAGQETRVAIAAALATLNERVANLLHR